MGICVEIEFTRTGICAERIQIIYFAINSAPAYIAGGCQWFDIFYKEDNENKMVQCQKCDYLR